MKRALCDKIFVLLLSLAILIAPLSLMLMPTRDFSKKENRPLSSAPELSPKSIASGSYFERFSEYVKDQFPLRDTLVSMRSLCELSLGRMQINGVILAENEALIRAPSEYNAERISENIEKMQASTQERATVYVPPRSIDVFYSYLPKSYDYEDDRTIFSALPKRAQELLGEYLQSASPEDHYKTDHHWSSSGAFLAYTQICKELGIEAYAEEYFQKEIASSAFRGTSFSRSGLPEYACDAEQIILYRYENDTKVRVTYHENSKTQNGFYDYSALGSSDEYRIFLGGNYSHLSISWGDEKEKKPSLLLIKDSFANSLIPFLALHYDIEVIDPRYCSSSFLREQLKAKSYDKILILLSLDTLSGIEL